MCDFFVSYTQADKPWAEWIAWQLERAGYKTRIQAWDFLPGTNLAAAIHEALRECRRVIPVLSPDYLASEFAQAEWTAALTLDPTGSKRLLVPVLVRRIVVTGLLKSLVPIPLADLDNEAVAARTLLDGVREYDPEQRMPRAQPPFPNAKPPAFPNALGPPVAEAITFTAECIVDERSVDSVLSSAAPAPVFQFHRDVQSQIDRVDDWWHNFALRSKVLYPEWDKAEIRDTAVTQIRARLRTDRDKIRGVVGAAPGKLRRIVELTAGESADLRHAALAQFARFTSLQIIRLIQFTDRYLLDEGPVVHKSFPGLPEVPAWLVDLVPKRSALGRFVFEEDQFLRARVGEDEDRYENVVAPRYVAQMIHQSAKRGDEQTYYRWVVPQWIHYGFDKPLPRKDRWMMFVLTDGMNRECYFSSSPRPWEE